MKIVSWNINGLRAILKKNFLEYLSLESPDILCLQEIKARKEQVPKESQNFEGYHAYWNSGLRPGYSGVLTLSKIKPKNVEFGFLPLYNDEEGRVIMTEFDNFILYNIYFPNGQKDEIRLKFKLDFYKNLLKHLNSLQKNDKKIIISGDYNTAHTEIDLTHPKANENTSGFLPVEREWLNKYIKHDFIDTFRYFTKEPNHYTWWSYRMNSRAKNVGWRIDYHFVSKNLLSKVKNSYIQTEIYGSDHCPIVLILNP